MNTPSLRLADSVLGKTIFCLFAIGLALLLTSGADCDWYSPLWGMIPIGIGCVLFAVSCVLKRAMPSFNIYAWMTMLGGGGYFLWRAFHSPAFYDQWADIGLITLAVIFYAFGYILGASRQASKALLALMAFLALSQLLLIAYQFMRSDFSPVLRPDFNFYLEPNSNIGFLGYKNFAANLMVTCGFFILAFCIFHTKRSVWYILIALLSIICSVWTNSRSVFPTAAVGIVLCWAIYLTKTYHQTKKFFIVSAVSFIAFLTGIVTIVITLDKNSKISTFLGNRFDSSERFNLAYVAQTIADAAPLIGNGARTFDDLAAALYVRVNAASYPNFAHNEYLQTLCDYGLIGLILLGVFLALHIISGTVAVFKARREEHSNTAAYPLAAWVVLCIGATHAYMDFIWHNPGIISISALCAGIIIAHAKFPVKAAGSWQKLPLSAGGLGTAVLCTAVIHLSLPYWEALIKFCHTNPQMTTERGQILASAAERMPSPELAHAYFNSLFQDEQFLLIPDPVQLDKLNRIMNAAVEKNPINPIIGCDHGMILNLQNKFEEAEQILRPYTAPGVYQDSIYPWRKFYIYHTLKWAKHTAQTNPEQAIDIMEKSRPVLALLYHGYYFPGNPKAMIEERFDFMEASLLLSQQRYEQAEPLLYKRWSYRQTHYPWKKIYIMHLVQWAHQAAEDQPAKALSLLRTARRLTQSTKDVFTPSEKQNLLDRLDFEIGAAALQTRNESDDSWKNLHTPQ